MKRFSLPIALMLIWCAQAHAQTTASSFDPCVFMPKQSVPINIATATDTQLVAAVTNASVYVCSIYLNQVNGTGSLGFEYGTGTNCGTGKTALNGPITAPSTGSTIINTGFLGQGVAGTELYVPSGNALCAVSTGTIQQSGWVSYIQTSDITHVAAVDPCSTGPKKSVPINMTTGGTTIELVPAIAGTTTYVCGLQLDQVNGASDSYTLEYGTKTSTVCDTGATALMGAIAPATTANLNTITGVGSENGGTQLVVPAGTELCEVSGSGSDQQGGWLTYTQRKSLTTQSQFDPCGQYPKRSAPFNLSSTTLTEVIPAISGLTTYVCGINWVDNGRGGTANTTVFEYGTKVTTACDTGATVLTGPITGKIGAGVPTVIETPPVGTDLVLPVNTELCVVDTQTSKVAGWVTYVQVP